MKTYNFNICKYHVTITIEKKPYMIQKDFLGDTQKCCGEQSNSLRQLSTYVPDELVDAYKSAPGLTPLKEGIRPISEALRPRTVNAKYVEFGETVVYHGPFPGYESEEIKMEEPECLCFMEAAEKYIDSKRGELAPSTIKGYENIIENHFNDLWLIWLDKLTEEHIQSAFNNEIEKGRHVKTLKGYRSFVLKVLAEYRPDFHPNIRVTKENTDENT